MRAILDAVPDGITVQDRTGRLVYVNDAAARLSGFDSAAAMLAASPEQLLSSFELMSETGEPLPLAELPGRLALQGITAEPRTIQFRIRATGERRWSLLRATPLCDDTGTVTHAVNAFQDITARIVAERELRASEARYRLAAEAAAELDEALEVETTVRVTTRIAVPRLADWCVIDLVQSDGSLRRAAVHVADGQRRNAAEALRAYVTQPGSASMMARALATGEVSLVEPTDGTYLSRPDADGAHAELMAQLDARSAIVVPLIARGRTLGVLALVRGWSGRRFSEDDVPVAEELGRRAALALANAELFEAEGAARREAEDAAERTHRLQRLTRSLAEARTRSDVAQVIVRQARKAFAADGAAVYVLADDEQSLEALATAGYPAEHTDAWRSVPFGGPTLMEQAVRRGEDLWVGDLAARVTEHDAVRRAVDLTGHHAVAVLPLATKGRTLGAIALSWGSPRPIDRREQDLGRAMADVAGQALDRATLAEAREALLADLELQRTRLTAVIEQMPGGVIIAEAPSGRLVQGNPQVDRIWGQPFIDAATVGGYAAYQGFHPDGSPYAAEEWPLARALGGEVVENEEIDFRRGDGTMGTMLASAAPIHDRDGTIVAGVVTFSDITERRARQERERYLTEASRILGSSLDYEETLRQIADLAVPTIADWCAIDLVGDDPVPDRLVVAHVDPSRVTLARELRERFPPDPDAPSGLAAVLRTGTSELVEDLPPEMIEQAPIDPEYKRALLSLELHSYMCVPLISSGSVLGAITFAGAESGRRFGQDDLRFAEALAARAAAAIENARLYRDRVAAQERLTRLASAEHARAAELDAVIRAMGEAIFVCDGAGVVTLANPAARELVGGRLARTYADILALLQDPTGIAPRLGTRSGPIELAEDDGEERWLEVSTYPVSESAVGSGDGGPPETIVVLRDVTEARQRQLLRETFVGVLSHELRTPVTTIYGGAKLLARGGLDEDRRRAVFEDIAVEAERLHRLVEDVIALNRFGEEDGDVGHEPVLLQRILPGVVRAEEVRWPGVQFTVSMPPGLPTVEADRTYVEQVVRNLLSNAAKYGGEGTTVETVAEADEREVRVRILDNGPGFPAEDGERLFDLFFRSASTSAAAPGAGIGLFVCARLIRAMGGRIWARNRDEGGSEFGFALMVMADD